MFVDVKEMFVKIIVEKWLIVRVVFGFWLVSGIDEDIVFYVDELWMIELICWVGLC